MKKLMIHAVTGLVCGLTLLTAQAAHAQEIETLWEPNQPQIERVDAGDRHAASDAVNTLFDSMLCATDSQSHYIIGQRQGQYLKKLVDVPPTQMKNYAPNTIYWWGQVQQGGLKGAQVAGLFTQVSPQQIDARLRIKHVGHCPVDVTVQYQMKKIYQRPGTSPDLYKDKSPNPGQTGTPGTGAPYGRMRIQFDQWGGIAGVCRQATIDTAQLSGTELKELSHKLDAANFFRLPSRLLTPGARDLFYYKITVDTGNGRYSVTTDDLAVPATLKPLIQWLQARATNAAGCPR
jgi:hypothetical protein